MKIHAVLILWVLFLSFEKMSFAAGAARPRERSYLQGMNHWNRSEWGLCFRHLQSAAGQGHAAAQYNLGWMYAQGRGVVQNDIAAVEWFRRSADQGLAPAQHYLGVMYEQGRGVV